jgi:hypothetical protein
MLNPIFVDPNAGTLCIDVWVAYKEVYLRTSQSLRPGLLLHKVLGSDCRHHEL